MTLLEIVQNLSNFDDEAVILIRESDPWTAHSEVIVEDAAEFGEKLPRIKDFVYFLEVEIAKDVLSTLHKWRNGKSITLLDEVHAVVHYAENDAYFA